MRLSLRLCHHLEVSPLQKGREPHRKQAGVLTASSPASQLHPGVALVVGDVWCVPTTNNRNPNGVSCGRVGHSRWGLTRGEAALGREGMGEGRAWGLNSS